MLNANIKEGGVRGGRPQHKLAGGFTLCTYEGGRSEGWREVVREGMREGVRDGARKGGERE